MAESAARPAFQLGRPRYDQVGVIFHPVYHALITFWFVVFLFNGFGVRRGEGEKKPTPSSALLRSSPLRPHPDAATFILRQSCFDELRSDSL